MNVRDYLNQATSSAKRIDEVYGKLSMQYTLYAMCNKIATANGMLDIIKVEATTRKRTSVINRLLGMYLRIRRIEDQEAILEWVKQKEL